MFKKVIFIVFFIIIFAVVISIAAIYGISYFVNIDKYKATYFKKIEQQTGFKVSCEKAEFIKSFNPHLKIHLHHTGIMYPNDTKFLQIKEAYLQVKLLPLLFKKIEIQNVQLERPIINITLYKDFSTSIEKFIDNKIKFNTKGFSLIIPSINAKNYKIKFQDNSINKIFYLEGENLSLNDIKLGKSAHIIIKGAIFENKKEYIKYNLDFLTSLDNKNQRFTFSPFKTIKENDVKCNILGHLAIDKELKGHVKIQDLSLKIGNILSKNNNINLNFNGDEAELDAVIHTSNLDSAKVKGKFGYRQKRYIDFNTNAKNINLENLFNIISSVSKILNIKNPLNETSAKGLLNADFNIKSDFKTLKSNGKAEIINGSVHNKLLPYPISNINANVDFNNNEIKIIKAETVINKTPVNAQGIIKSDLTLDIKAYSNFLDLKTVTMLFIGNKNLPVEIKKGNLSFKTEIQGNLSGDYTGMTDVLIKDLNFVENISKIPVYAKNTVFKVISNNNKINGNVKSENIDFKLNKKPVKVNEFNFTFDDKNINIARNKIFFISSPVFIDGNIKNYPDNIEGKINFEGEIEAADIAAALSNQVNQPYKAKGKIKIQGNSEFYNDKFKLKSKIHADKDNYISYIVIKELLNKSTVTNIDIEGDKNEIIIKKAALELNNEPQIKITGKIENLKTPKLKNVNVIIPKIVSIASNFLGGEEISLKSDLILNGALKNPEIKGDAKILSYKIKKYLTHIKNTDVSFMPQKIRVVAPDVIINNSNFNVIADIEPDFNNITVSNIQLSSLNLDINSLYKIIRELQNEKKKIVVKKGRAIINNFKIGDIRANDITSNFKIEKNTLKMYDIISSAYSGIVTGKADYEIGSGILNIDMEGKGIDVKTSMRDLSGFDDNLLGQTDFKATVSMLTGNKHTVLKTLSGAMEFNAKSGAMGTLGKFEYYLYAQNLLYHGVLNTTINRLIQTISHDDTTHYSYAEGKLLFKNGYIIADSIHTKGENMSLFVKGRHNILTNQSSLDIYGRISDEITKKMGSFGDVSVSDIVNGSQTQKNNVVMVVSKSFTDEILPLNNNKKSNMFKVNVIGDIKALNAINSFTWILPNKNEFSQTEKHSDNAIEKEVEIEKEETLPDFSDL